MITYKVLSSLVSAEPVFMRDGDKNSDTGVIC